MTTGMSAGGKPKAVGLSEPEEGSEERLRVGLQGPCLGREVSGAPLGVVSPGSATTLGKEGHPQLLALPPRNRGAAGAPAGGGLGGAWPPGRGVAGAGHPEGRGAAGG